MRLRSFFQHFTFIGCWVAVPVIFVVGGHWIFAVAWSLSLIGLAFLVVHALESRYYWVKDGAVMMMRYLKVPVLMRHVDAALKGEEKS